MDLFINELSFHGQFPAAEPFIRALPRFLKLVDAGRRVIQELGGRMWRSDSLGNAYAVRGEPLHKFLNRMADREIAEQFKDVVYNKANPAPWEPNRKHSENELWLWLKDTGGDECVTNSSVAELGARILLREAVHGCLLNLGASAFEPFQSIRVRKEELDAIELSALCEDSVFEAWLRRLYPGLRPKYSPDDKDPPRDDQTCLLNARLFKSTSYVYDGRKIYEHKIKKWLFYVDNMHFGLKAHLEVFDKLGREHLGEASIDTGDVDFKKKDPKKKPLGI